MRRLPNEELERQRQRLNEIDRSRDRAAQEDVVIDAPRRLFLRSPNGTYWSVGVGDDGAVFAVSMGANVL